MRAMQSPDTEVIGTAGQWVGDGHAVTLVTVARTWGSAPRPEGSLMAVRGDGPYVGSVSGGCVEEDLVQRLRDGELAVERPTRCTYGLRRDEAERLGLPCGGRLELVLEPVDGTSALSSLARRMDERQLVARRVDLNSGRVEQYPVAREGGFHYDGHSLTKVFGPRRRLLLVGAGQAARYLAEMARAVDFDVVVCEPRREQAALWPVSGTVLEPRMPDEAVLAWACDPRSAVVTLTHDPRLDDMALMEALLSDAFYVGALGSRASSRKRRERLRELGLPSRAVDRLHAPVGLPIGSRTPAEIALSVLAQLTAASNRGAQSGKATMPRPLTGVRAG